MEDWKHFSQVFTITKKRTLVQRIVDFFIGNRFAVEKIEINFLYNGDVEPDVILSGLIIAKVDSAEKIIKDF